MYPTTVAESQTDPERESWVVSRVNQCLVTFSTKMFSGDGIQLDPNELAALQAAGPL